MPFILRRGSLNDFKLNQVNNLEHIVSEIIELEKMNKSIDGQIYQLNELVYDLYDITEEEKILIGNYISDKLSKLNH